MKNINIDFHDEEAEAVVLGGILLDSNALEIVSGILSTGHFYSKQNQIIYNAILELSNNDVSIDTFTLGNQLKASNKLEESGGLAYISNLINYAVLPANIDHYVNIILDRFLRRKLIKMSLSELNSTMDLCAQAMGIINDVETKTSSLVETKIFDLVKNNKTLEIESLKDTADELIDTINQRHINRSALTGIPSGFSILDTYTTGFHKSELIIIAARPAIGKTALALSMMRFIAIEKEIPCGFLSLEKSKSSITERLTCMEANVSLDLIRSGNINKVDFPKLQDAFARFYTKPFYMVDTPNMELLEIKALARRMKKSYGIKILFIDHIGLIASDKPHLNVKEAIADISNQLKSLASELQIPIVVLSQLNHEAECKEANIDQISEFGAIEGNADVVILLEREHPKDSATTQPAVLSLVKQRNGPKGNIDIAFISSTIRYENAAKS